MSFWTDVHYVRPTRPPAITVAELLAFADRVAATGIVHDPTLRTLKVKLGARIDQDHLGTTRETKIAPGMFQVRDIDWDISAADQDEVQRLRDQPVLSEQTIYRAYLGFEFSALAPHIRAQLQTPHPDDGNLNLVFADVSIQVDVLTASGLDSEQPVQVGWLGVGFGGRGYLYPWTPQELIQRVRSVPELAAVEQLCEAAFPISADARQLRWYEWRKRRRARQARRMLGPYWPFEDDWPSHWTWAIHETG